MDYWHEEASFDWLVAELLCSWLSFASASVLLSSFAYRSVVRDVRAMFTGYWRIYAISFILFTLKILVARTGDTEEALY